MTVHEAIIAKIQQMPEPMVQEVQDYADYLLKRDDTMLWQTVQYLSEAETLAEAGMSDYLPDLEAYEAQLVLIEVQEKTKP